MKLKNSDLSTFINYISTHSLSSTEGRMRNRLKKILNDKAQESENERLELVNEHSRKDEQGNTLTLTNENGQPIGDIIDINLFNVALNSLLNEYVYVEENLSNKQMLETMKSIILNDSKEYFGQDADIWEFACTTVEEINYPDIQSQVGD